MSSLKLSLRFQYIIRKLSNLPGSGHGFSPLQNYSQTFFHSLYYLTELSLTNNYINDSTFQFFLVHFANNGSLTKLDFSYNAIKTFPAARIWNLTYGITFLSLSHNALEGEIPSLADVDSIYTRTIEHLNLSYNSFTSLPTQWANTFHLEVLDLSHNNLTGGISSLDILVQNCFGSLRELYVSDNNLMGVLNSSLYFSRTTNLSIGNFDRNHIEGTLDLTRWFGSLLQAATNASAPKANQSFSFVDNVITDIIPDAEDLQQTIDTLLESNADFNQTGVFLGGNPYCKRAKTKTQLYLCRSTNTDPYVVPEKKNKALMVGVIVGGIFASLVGCLLLAMIGKLWKKVSVLQQIQKALANQKVHPPLFSYNDLKFATRDFHKDNKLGKGAFGVVYKGLLGDGTTLAVKKLFNSQRVQVLNEFLNEVVLITGIKHRNLVQLKGCCINDKQRILVYEYVENGNLAEALWDKQSHGILDWQQRFNICVGVARGLSYLHEELHPRIIHRDIKPANILLDNNFYPKIADFGLARPFLDEQSRAKSTQLAGTMGYWAPEYAIQGQLTDKADVFSFGTLALEIISGRKCIDHNRPPDEVFLRDWAIKLHKDGMLLNLLQPEVRQNCIEADVIRVINIALICVQLDPKQRTTMSQVVIMLLGSMDVTVLLDIGSDKRPNFNNLLPTNDYHDLKNTSSLSISDVIDEECDESPFLDIKSSIHMNSSSSSTIHNTIELIPISGR